MDTKFSDYFSVKLMWSRIPYLVKKIPITLELAGLAFLVSIVIGLLIAVIRYKKVKILSPIATAFLSLMRGTPMLIQLYVAYYGIPAILRIFNSWGANIDVKWFMLSAPSDSIRRHSQVRPSAPLWSP